jgi:hypothetical protein
MFSNSFNIALKKDSKLLTIKPNSFLFNPDFNFKIRIVSRFISAQPKRRRCAGKHTVRL